MNPSSARCRAEAFPSSRQLTFTTHAHTRGAVLSLQLKCMTWTLWAYSPTYMMFENAYKTWTQ